MMKILLKKTIKINFFLILLLLQNNFNFSQVNLFDKDEKLVTDLENSVMFRLIIGDLAYSLQLPNIPDGTYIETACNEIKQNFPFPYILIGVRENKNLFYSIFYALILDNNGFYTDKCYVGFMKRQYGETQNYLIKTKRERVYTENNIFTEKILLNNGILLTIEDKRYIRKIKLPGKDEFYLDEYYFKDCD